MTTSAHGIVSCSDGGGGGGRSFKGVRMRAWGRWVSEIRVPKSRERVWLGSFPTAIHAARAFDAAALYLRGPDAALNLPHLATQNDCFFYHHSNHRHPRHVQCGDQDDAAPPRLANCCRHYIRSIATAAAAALLYPPPSATSPSLSSSSSYSDQDSSISSSSSPPQISCCSSTVSPGVEGGQLLPFDLDSVILDDSDWLDAILQF